jgi:phospholipid/cholesterol/gamma-HCH transport system substrate-binding protein
MRQALQGFSEAARASSELAATTSKLAEASQPELLATLQEVRKSSEDLRAITGEFRSRLTGGTALADLDETARHAREAAKNAERLSAALAEIAEDPEIHAELREAVSDIHDAAQSAKQVGEDLEVLSGELREAAPAVSAVAGEAEEMAGTAESLRERLQPPDIKARFDVVYSGEANRWFSTGNLDFSNRPNRFFRLGLDDIGEENDFNAQIGDRQGRTTIRYGLFRSRLGVGVDFDLPRRTTLSLDLFDPNNVRADVMADIPVVPGRSDWSVLLGARDIGEEDLFVGGIRLKR